MPALAQPALAHGAGAHASLSVLRRRNGPMDAAVDAVRSWAIGVADVHVLVATSAALAADLGWGDGEAGPEVERIARAAGARTQTDLLVQVSASTRPALTQALRGLDPIVRRWWWRDEEIVGGWDEDGREPFGFLDRRRMPAPETAVAPDGSTWLGYARFELDRLQLADRPPAARARVMGVTEDGGELDGGHLAAMRAWRELLRRGFPYRRGGVEGLVFIGAAPSARTLALAIEAFFSADPLRAYATAVSSGLYFAPPRSRLAQP